MANVGSFVLFFVLIVVAGCGDQEGAVATEEQIKAHVEAYGDQHVDPTGSTPLID